MAIPGFPLALDTTDAPVIGEEESLGETVEAVPLVSCVGVNDSVGVAVADALTGAGAVAGAGDADDWAEQEVASSAVATATSRRAFLFMLCSLERYLIGVNHERGYRATCCLNPARRRCGS